MFARKHLPSLALVATSVMVLGACGDDDDDPIAPEVTTYAATLQPLNGSGVTGTAIFEISDGVFGASVEAVGLDANIVHPQHIHLAAACPTEAADTNNDDFIDVVEGIPAYGPILVPLDGDLAGQSAGSEGYPVASNIGVIDYLEFADLSAMLADLRATDPDPNDPIAKLMNNAELDPAARTVVLHGVAPSTQLPASVQTIAGLPPQTSLPVACGTIELVN